MDIKDAGCSCGQAADVEFAVRVARHARCDVTVDGEEVCLRCHQPRCIDAELDERTAGMDPERSGGGVFDVVVRHCALHEILKTVGSRQVGAEHFLGAANVDDQLANVADGFQHIGQGRTGAMTVTVTRSQMGILEGGGAIGIGGERRDIRQVGVVTERCGESVRGVGGQFIQGNVQFLIVGVPLLVEFGIDAADCTRFDTHVGERGMQHPMEDTGAALVAESGLAQNQTSTDDAKKPKKAFCCTHIPMVPFEREV